MRPVVLTCGEPAGVGPEIAVAAKNVLGADVPFVWIGDPRHLPDGAAFQIIEAVDRAAQAAGPFGDCGSDGGEGVGEWIVAK